jgi:hypothetical protein
VNDFIHSGSAATLSTVTAGLAYRLRIAGYSSGAVASAILPANTVNALDDYAPGLASNTAFFSYTPATSGYSA